MAFWIAGAAGLVIAYFFGSVPTGYLAGKLLKGIDIREHGSKATGATNVLRTLGKWPALAVLVADVLKGVGAIFVARSFCPWLYTVLSPTPPTAVELQNWVPWAVCLAGIAALLGHSRSIWLNFTGGKSAATGLGVLLAMSWPVGVGVATVFGIVLAIARIVSLGSILAALTAIVLVFAFEQPLPFRLLVIGGGIYVIVRHRPTFNDYWRGQSRAWVEMARKRKRKRKSSGLLSGVSMSHLGRLWPLAVIKVAAGDVRFRG